jgi:hypothetical protein
MSRTFDPSCNTVTTTRKVTAPALDLLSKAQGGLGFEVHLQDLFLLDGTRVASMVAARPLIEDLLEVGLLSEPDGTWHETYHLTPFAAETTSAYLNPPKPTLSLPLLLHRTVEQTGLARKAAEEAIHAALEEAGMEVGGVTIEPARVQGGLHLCCTARFLDDTESEDSELISLIEQCLDLPDDFFEETPDEARLVNPDQDGVWTLWFCGPHLEDR